MSLRSRPRERQADRWIAATDVAPTHGHSFYERLNGLLAEAKFDSFVEELCRPFCAEGTGRPGIPPGIYMRMLLVGFLESLASECGILPAESRSALSHPSKSLAEQARRPTHA